MNRSPFPDDNSILHVKIMNLEQEVYSLQETVANILKIVTKHQDEIYGTSFEYSFLSEFQGVKNNLNNQKQKL